MINSFSHLWKLTFAKIAMAEENVLRSHCESGHSVWVLGGGELPWKHWEMFHIVSCSLIKLDLKWQRLMDVRGICSFIFNLSSSSSSQHLSFECRVTLQVLERGRAQSADANNLAPKPGKWNVGIASSEVIVSTPWPWIQVYIDRLEVWLGTFGESTHFGWYVLYRWSVPRPFQYWKLPLTETWWALAFSIDES